MENERRDGDDLRDAIMDYIYSDGDGNDLDLLAGINLEIGRIESVIDNLKKQRDMYKEWYHKEHKIVEGILK